VANGKMHVTSYYIH